MPYEQLAREFLRALRGSRSQLAFSRWLGYGSNVAHAWEGGRRFPAASEALRAAARAGVDVGQAFRAFFTEPPAWLDAVGPTSPEAIARLLQDLRGGTPIGALAERAGASRYAVSRWLHGHAEPRLPELFAMIEAASGRLPDWIAGFVAPESLPSLRARWEAVEQRRALASTHPWSLAVLRALETEAYRALPAHRPGWLAAALGIPVAEEARCLEALEQTGLIHWHTERFETTGGALVDTRRHPDAGRALKRHWARVGEERLARGDDGLWSFNVFNVSRADLARLRALHLEYFRTFRAIVGASEPLECVAVANVQLFELRPAPAP